MEHGTKWKDHLNRQRDDNIVRKAWQYTVRCKRDSGHNKPVHNQFLISKVGDSDVFQKSCVKLREMILLIKLKEKRSMRRKTLCFQSECL